MSERPLPNIYPIPLAIATYLGYNGYKKGSLSQDGALTAAFVGYATLANPFIGPGLTLICFYFAGSRATKYKAGVKASLETHSSSDPLGPREDDKEGAVVKKRRKDLTAGNRSGAQVLCNSAIATIAAVTFRVLNSGLGGGGCPDPLGKGLLKVVRVFGGSSIGVSNLLLTLVVGGHYAACMGDTLASELGILSSSQPRLITAPWKLVPKGTNGGVSAWGLVVSALGGTLIGVVQSISLYLHYYFHNQQQIPVEGHVKLISLLTAAGLVGSLIDSVLGATLQQTLVNKRSKKVLVGGGHNTDVIDGKNQDDPNAEWVKVTGVDVLTNNGVNFLASMLTAVGTAWVGLKLF